MHVKIRNWSRYNPRSDVKNSTWFRLENDFLTDSEFFDLSADQKLVWIALLSEASRRTSGVVFVSLSKFAAIVRTTDETVAQTIDYLVSRAIVERVCDSEVIESLRARDDADTDALRARYADVTLPSRKRGLRYDTIRNETKKRTNNPPAPPSRPPREADPLDLELADEWVAFAKSRSDTAKPDRGKYADAMRQMRKLGLSPEDVRATLAWIKASEFWSKVGWSPVQLVKAKDGTRKLDTVRAQMAASKPKPAQSIRTVTLEDIA